MTTRHVLVVINALGEGGTERSMAELMPAIEPHGFRFTLATLRSRGDEGVEPSLRHQGYEIARLPGGLASQIRGLRRLLRARQPDLVHSMLYEANLVARLGSFGTRTPVITSLVSTSYSTERVAAPGTSRPKLRAVQILDALTGCLFVDRFHAVSEAVARDARRHLLVGQSKISVVPRGRVDPCSGIHPDSRIRIRSELGIPFDALVAVNVGRHEFPKDHRTLVRAIAPLMETHPNLWLAIAGREGSETSALKAKLDQVANTDRILLLGHRGDVAALLAAADVFVMTSRYEGMPGAVIEAMGAGLPVVASDIGPVREVVTVGATALVVPVGDAPAFGRAIEELLNSLALRDRLGQAGRDAFERRFRIDESAGAMASLYEDVITGRVSTTHSGYVE